MEQHVMPERKFLVQWVVPEHNGKKVVVAATPEQAASQLADPHRQDIIVEELGSSEEAQRVLAFCSVCGQPVWVEDDPQSYIDMKDDGVLAHRECV